MERENIDVIVCTSDKWCHYVFNSRLAVTDASGTVRAFVQTTSDPKGDLTIANAIADGFRNAWDSTQPKESHGAD